MLKFVYRDYRLIRQRLAEALGNLKTEKSIAALKFLAKDSHLQVSQAAAISLKRLEG